MNRISRKKAFTLAEVLITLAIIGVVAAMTIPSVLNHVKETQLKTGLKKAQSVLSEALQLMIYETGIPVNGKNYTTRTFFASYKKYFSKIKDCSYSGCITASSHKTYNNGSISTVPLDDGQIIINDGMILAIENAPGWGYGILISVDVNGSNKPNKWGHDLFTFAIDEETAALIPMGQEGTYFEDENTYCSKTSSNTYNGVGCTYKALTEKDYFKNLP